jgi:hypothetical protein
MPELNPAGPPLEARSARRAFQRQGNDISTLDEIRNAFLVDSEQNHVAPQAGPAVHLADSQIVHVKGTGFLKRNRIWPKFLASESERLEQVRPIRQVGVNKNGACVPRHAFSFRSSTR